MKRKILILGISLIFIGAKTTEEYIKIKTAEYEHAIRIVYYNGWLNNSYNNYFIKQADNLANDSLDGHYGNNIWLERFEDLYLRISNTMSPIQLEKTGFKKNTLNYNLAKAYLYGWNDNMKFGNDLKTNINITVEERISLLKQYFQYFETYSNEFQSYYQLRRIF